MCRKNSLMVFSVLLITVLLSGCTTLMQQITDQGVRRGVSSSLVDYLYPRGETPPEFDQTIPTLQLPLRVGIAFVPSHADNSIALTASHKSKLLNKIKGSFNEKPFVNEIVVIPDTYLRSSRGFDNVDQVARLYSLDVMALVSYDQVVYTDDTRASLLYWTIVGAYFINGSKNDINTFVDVAVFDIKSHKLLLRAPGTDEVIAKSALINNSDKLRIARQDSFTTAIDNLSDNLEVELNSFKKRIKQDKSVEFAYRPGFSGGGGSIEWVTLMIMTGLLITKHGLHYIRRRRFLVFRRFWKYSPDPRF
ncbi:MAG: rhombotarget lipoprotein [Gammaproteobacteria bacterium]